MLFKMVKQVEKWGVMFRLSGEGHVFNAYIRLTEASMYAQFA